jgi:hypothetical protein
MGMPPERVIEFKIELQPGTAPYAKAPYKISLVEMKELTLHKKLKLETKIEDACRGDQLRSEKYDAPASARIRIDSVEGKRRQSNFWRVSVKLISETHTLL